IGKAATLFKNFTIKVESEAGFTVGEGTTPYLDFILGGYGFQTINNLRLFYVYNFLSLTGDSYISGLVTLDYEFLKKNHINFSANYGNVRDNLFQSVDWVYKADYSGYAIGYGLETIIGPVEVKYSWSPEHATSYTWFTVGFWF